MTHSRFSPSDLLRGQSSAPTTKRSVASAVADTLHRKTLTLTRRGGAVAGVKSLHRALRQGWRVLRVFSETPPDAAPLDFSVRVLLGRTEHVHVSDMPAPPAPSAAVSGSASAP